MATRTTIKAVPAATTLLDLVFKLRGGERRVVAEAMRLVRAGEVELTGNFRGHRF